ncbi:Hid-1 family protein P27G11.12 [Smittium mucronatum]|uniref:Hid-1 family protein P27G11.12 n=1 Tax=Smittium mucronatum TaxID=133383 RepID=A0A1R0H6I4_9FUNG|nr:Hid-1 family protein P27G11.12 [Smittium mucronatum]
MGGSASKLEFRKRVFYLSENRNLSGDSVEIWAPFWSLPDSPNDVFSLVTTRDIRRIRDVCPENFITLYKKPDEVSNPSRLEDSGIGYLLAEISLRLFHTPGLTVADLDSKIPANPNCQNSLNIVNSSNSVSENSDASLKYPIWTNGIGVPSPPLTTLSTSPEIYNNRIEVLNLLLALSSKEIYYNAQASIKSQNKILEHIVTHSNDQLILSLLCSLINTSLKIHKKKVFPFSYKSEFGSLDSDVLCSILCSQFLSILMGSLIFQNKNKIYLFTSKIHRTQEFEFIIKNSISILNESLESSLSLIATVSQSQNNSLELLTSVISTLLLIAECNSDFVNYLGDHNEATHLFVLLSRFLLMHKSQISKNGLCKLIVYLLRKLSEVRTFSVNMMRPFFNYYSLIPIHLRPMKNTGRRVSNTRSTHNPSAKSTSPIEKNLSEQTKSLSSAQSNESTNDEPQEEIEEVLVVKDPIGSVPISTKPTSEKMSLDSAIKDTKGKQRDIEHSADVTTYPTPSNHKESESETSSIFSQNNKEMATLSKSSSSQKQQIVSKGVIDSFIRILPSKQILTILDALYPHVHKIMADSLAEQQIGMNGTAKVLRFLSDEKVVDFVPQSLSDGEKEKMSKPIHLFFYSINGNNPSGGFYLVSYKTIVWVRIFVVGSKPLGLFNGSNIKLFLVKQN